MNNRPKPAQHAAHERWLVSYADFMTLLFALFVVLFASAQRNNAGIEQVAAAVKSGFREMGSTSQPTSAVTTSDLTTIQQQLNQALGKEIATHQVTLRDTSEGFVISLQELGFFESAQASLLPAATSTLRRIAAVLIPHGRDIRIEGHSDNVPIHTVAFASNWELSTARATSVANLLINDAHLAPGHIAIAGYGQYHPAALNETPEGRRSNRRVDIVVLSH